MTDKINEYIKIKPSRVQSLAQRRNFNAFIHYGLNTFTGQEWGDGKVSPSLFNPSDQNTDQWIGLLKEAGVDTVIITAKHHDGFCLWQTKTTNYSVASSPYKNGKGDVVKEVSDSCKKAGLRFGIYLSPWDRNCEFYGVDNDKYNKFYIEQLTELLTNYGEVSYVWLDGACGAHLDGKPKQVYDFEAIYAKVRELAPNACISNCGPDIRWVGNEAGVARKSEFNVVPKFACDIQTIERNSQQEDNEDFAKKGADIIFDDLGSREFLANFNDFMWYPAEVDVSIRPGWFYHKNQDNKVRSLNNLMNIYYTSVGGNSFLLLNIPPDKRGLFNENDEKRLKGLGNSIRSAFKNRAQVIEYKAPDAQEDNGIINVDNIDFDEVTGVCKNYYTPSVLAEKYEILLKFDKVYNIDKVRLIENCEFSQRIESFKIYALQGNRETLAYKGTTIGFNRIAVFKSAIKANGVKIVIDKCRSTPYIEHISVYETDGFIPKTSVLKKIILKIHKWNYMIYIKRENKKNKLKD